MVSAWRIFVHHKPSFADHRGEGLKKEWRHAGYPVVKKVRAGQAYEISGDLDQGQLEELARKLLADPVTQMASILPSGGVKAPAGVRLAQIWPKPGVSDPVAETVKLGARDLDLSSVRSVRSGAVFEFWGAPAKDVKSFCEGFLMNPLVQKVEVL